MNTHLQYTNNSGTSQTLAITDLLTSANSGNYGYDALNRLKTETKGNSQNTFDYDPVGNRLNKASENTTTNTTDNQNLTYAISSNRLATKDGNALAHDNNGNTLQDGTKSWTYNARNRMSQFKLNGIVQADYQHNATGERVLKIHGSETIAYFYNGAGQLLNEIHYNNSGEQTAHTAYIWLGDMPLAVIKQNHSGGTITSTQIAYIHSDHLNTPRLATDQTGQTLWQWQSTAFGEQAANEDVDGDGQLFTLNLRFPGQYYDQESGLNYNYFRDYDPTTGRYVQSDPIGLAGGLNTFTYVGGSPLVYIDPIGLLCLTQNQINLLSAFLGGGIGGFGTTFNPIGGLVGALSALAFESVNIYSHGNHHLSMLGKVAIGGAVGAVGSPGSKIAIVTGVLAVGVDSLSDGSVTDSLTSGGLGGAISSFDSKNARMKNILNGAKGGLIGAGSTLLIKKGLNAFNDSSFSDCAGQCN